jgi:dipeptidyl aminopeptidase/acylaminoacyl peptidase
MTRTAPYGTWSSLISAELVASDQISLELVRIRDGAAYWLEARPAEEGRYVIVTTDGLGAARDLTPPGFSARTKVHEYGGGSYWLGDGVVFFANFEDQRLYRTEDGSDPQPLTPATDGRHRYADGEVSADGSFAVCVRERHDGKDVINELVVIPTDGSAPPQIVAGGRDFYSDPRISSDGKRLAWLTWDLPWMPWDGCELWVGDLSAEGSVSNPRHVAGELDGESLFQPMWSPSGELHVVSDRSGWWNLYVERGGELLPLHPAEAEFGWPKWEFAENAYGFLGDGRIACLYQSAGAIHLGILDPVSTELLDIDLPFDAEAYPSLACEGDRVLFIGASALSPQQIVLVDLTSRSVEVLKQSAGSLVDAKYFSVPRAIDFPTEGGLSAHAFFYPPANGDFEAPTSERPPLIVMSHGGPTSAVSGQLDLQKQFFTSRGFAVVDVNYGGSTGYGREYRKRLNGNWGIVDTADCINAARYLATEGDVDADRLVIRGGSAGGYTTLCALTFHDDFAAGASYFGLADLEDFAKGGTHKFELQYEHTLVGPYPEAAEVYRERSPIHFVDRLSCPMIVLQGDEDEVVPPAQAEMMVEALRAKGLPYTYILFAGEQHGFRKAVNIATSLESEISFYAQVLGFELGDPIKPVAVENAPKLPHPA